MLAARGWVAALGPCPRPARVSVMVLGRRDPPGRVAPDPRSDRGMGLGYHDPV